MTFRRASRSPSSPRPAETARHMKAFSASDAALEGFQMLRLHWRVVLGWCLFTVLSFIGLMVLAVIAIAVATTAIRSPDQANTVGGAIGGLVLGLGGAAIQWVVLTALYRVRAAARGAARDLLSAPGARRGSPVWPLDRHPDPVQLPDHGGIPGGELAGGLWERRGRGRHFPVRAPRGVAGDPHQPGWASQFRHRPASAWRTPGGSPAAASGRWSA